MPVQKKQPVNMVGCDYHINDYKYQAKAVTAWRQAIALIKKGKVRFIPVGDMVPKRASKDN